jgi:hypothetical protein
MAEVIAQLRTTAFQYCKGGANRDAVLGHALFHFWGLKLDSKGRLGR